MAIITEIAPDLFRISIYAQHINMQFNHFLVRDEEPLLFHTGLKAMFPELNEAVAKVIDPASLRHIAWSHFESDECGALNEWLEIAPNAQPVCTLVGKIVNVDDFSIRPAFGMTADDILRTGKYSYRFHRSPHIPHGWDAGVLFEEVSKTLFCSDLFHHFGDAEPMTSSDLIGPTQLAMQQMQTGPLAGYMPYTRQTEGVLRALAELKPETLAVMHGSSFSGNCAGMLVDLAGVIKENFDKERI
ncbi:MAG: MBL fold metallo-hydrolase [Deltaproteobacteria bacterium]|nr:MBL fold metallo-hydrolase [Deltaproteobacteria bacterium]